MTASPTLERPAVDLWARLRPVDRADWLRFHTVTIDDHPVSYGQGGDGPPVLFLHGWALGHTAYKRTLRRLTARGRRVIAPAMPGFAGTPALPADQRDLEGYAAWATRFLDAIGVTEPVMAVGHSFGGGVATRLAFDQPERVGYLVLVNAVGGAAWGKARPMDERPLWHWVAEFSRELFPPDRAVEMLRAIAGDLSANLRTNPLGLWQVGQIARTADLRPELAELARRGTPVLALSSTGDGVIPDASFEALCSAIGAEGRRVSGNHTWLLTDPDAFGEVLDNVLRVQAAAEGAPELSEMLEATSVPTELIDSLLAEAAPLWLQHEAPAGLAGDLALCWPDLGADEVRAVARPIEGCGDVQLTVVAHDRAGLMADTAAVLAAQGLSVSDASAVTWPSRDLALHSLTVTGGASIDDTAWGVIGERLRLMARGQAPVPRYSPSGRVAVAVNGEAGGRQVVTVSADDRVGLLWAICAWFADHGVSIEGAHVSTFDRRARDGFIVVGAVDGEALADHLS